jgi:hypothetical protein
VFSVHGTNLDQDIVVAKYDPAGNVLWARQFGGESLDEGNGIALDQSGNSYITGNSSSTNLVFGSIVLTNNYNLLLYTTVFIAKLDANGNALWARDAQGNNEDSGQAVAVDFAGNSYIAGFFQSTVLNFGALTITNTEPQTFGGGPADAFIAKYDPLGNLLWVLQPVGTNDQRAFSVGVDSRANAYVTGWTQGTNVLFGNFAVTNAYLDVFIAKIESDYAFLNLQPAGPNEVVSWPTNKNGFTLECSSNLQDWSPATNAIGISGGCFAATNTPSWPASYFRLQKSP